MVFPFFVLINFVTIDFVTIDFVTIDLCRLKCTCWNVTVGICLSQMRSSFI